MQLKRSVLHMAREGITATSIARICHCSPSSVKGSHDIVAILENRLTKTIREHFMNRYTNRERAAVKSVVVDLNAQYIKALFPNARIIIDRFHIIQLVLTASSMISPTVRLKE